MVSSAQPEAVADEVTANEDEQEPPTLPSPPTPAPVVVPPTAQTKRSEEVFPGSAEEAAALLGASITRCGSVGTHNEVVLPPVGMHPAFAVSSRNNTTELVHRLYHLRALLRTVAASHREKLMQQRLDEAQGKGVEKIPPPLPAAPSILQVLKKLLGVSTQMAAAAPGGTESGAILAATSSSSEKNGTMVQQQKLPATNHSTDPAVVVPQRRVLILKNKLETPPMWSTPCRKLWVECVVLCHALSVSSSSSSSDQATQFVRQMLALASIHPRSAKAAGGVRIAALSVVAALLEHDEDNDNPVYDGTSARPPTYALASQLAPWSLDILQVCLKALRSAGNGEPTFRQAAIRAACATAMACRNAAWKHRNDQASGTADALSFVYPGAMEDKAVMESIKVLKQAATDKFPEVRLVGATYAAVLAPVIVASPSTTASSSHGSHDVLGALEEVIQLALRNLDDEFPAVSTAWAEAVARCMTTAVQYNEATKKSNSQQSSELGGEIGVGADASPSISTQVTRFGSRRPVLLVLSLQTVKKAIGFLVEQFVSVGGELTAAKGGGTFSIGGRMVRLGYSIALFKFLQLQTSPMLSAIGESRSLSIQATISHILDMVGTKTEEQLRNTASRSWSKADASLVRLYTCRVLRQGLSHLATEPTHIAILQDLIGMIPLSNVHDSKESASPKSSKVESLNASQMQVVLVEISHLFATLGEATSSRVSETLTKLQLCMSHDDDGVRHEACIACTALVECFPLQAPKLIESALGAIQDGLAGIGSTPVVKAVEVMKVSLGGFRRPQQPSDSSTEVWRTHEYSIHGRALLVSMLVKDLPKVKGGLSRSILRSVMSVAETLVSCQTNDNVTTLNSDAACVCVRAGFCMISAALTTGPGAIDIHMSQILSNWQNAGKAVIEGGQFFTIQQELSCLDALLSSIVAFLKYCSELLLSIPEALSKITMLLEDMFALVQSNGRLGAVTKDAVVASRLESSKASLLEAFAWLPSGSFPLVSDEVFVFAAAQIRMAVDNNVSCSILCSLIAREDSLLDAKPLCRANKNGQVAGERGMEESITLLTGEIAADSERETVLHLRSVKIEGILEETRIDHRRSSILEAFVSDIKAEKPPTPLHEVGTWRRPADPSCSSQVRIVDAAIQAFSATFGLKDGKEQQGAMDMLEQLVPPLLARFARSIGINTLSENERRAKVRSTICFPL